MRRERRRICALAAAGCLLAALLLPGRGLNWLARDSRAEETAPPGTDSLVPAPPAPNSTCWSCHLEMEGDEEGPAHRFAQDIHVQNGLTCSDCHGGSPSAEDMDAVRSDHTFRGAPKGQGVIALCARCHSDASFMRKYNPSLPVDQAEKYATSVHGQRLRQGDTNVAVCTSCHGAHGILPADHPRSSVYARNLPATCNKCHGNAELMKPYGIPTDQFEGYEKSVHGIAVLQKGDLSAPACNDCHGNHGAVPPGVESVGRVCGTCHAINEEMYSSGPHAAAFESGGIPECEACHGNHDIAPPGDVMLDPERGVCSRCHSQGDAGMTAAAAMYSTIDSLSTSYDQAVALLDHAARKGMEVSESVYDLKDARQCLIETRTTTHTVTEARVHTTAGKGMEITAKAIADGRHALSEYRFRREGLGVATLVLSVFAAALYLKIRQMESRQRK